ncbi:MAG: oligoendopeptidase F [Myxococcota bacterium]
MKSKLILAVMLCAAPAIAGEREVSMNRVFFAPGEMSKDGSLPSRDSIEAGFKWELTHLYRDDAAWDASRAELDGIIAKIGTFKGRLGGATGTVKETLELWYRGRHLLARLAAYAMMKYDSDTRVPKAQGMKSTMDKAAASYAEAVAWIEPELLSLDPARLQALQADPSLGAFSQVLRNVSRKKPHVLSGGEEGLLAGSSLMGVAPYNIYTTYTSADMSFGEFTDPSGKKVKLSVPAYLKYRQDADRTTRRNVFESFFGAYSRVRNFMASALSAQVDANVFYAKARKYGSALEAALFPDNIPPTLYENLIKNINSNIPALHRYLEMRRQLLGLDGLRYYDLYVPVIGNVEIKSDYASGVKMVLDSLSVMGPEYLKIIGDAMTPGSGWVDVYPNEGKKTGAYMTGDHYDVHPYVLLNFVENYDSVSTLAHEMGHAMHSRLSNTTQPHPKADYPIFLAEVASTFHEALLIEHMLKTVKDPMQRLYLLVESMEMFRTTMFRQAMFAEFELDLYRSAERREPLTAEAISAKYLALLKKYYGHDKGVVTIDDSYSVEWAYIPHFYYNFYVYQYVTGFIAANALAQEVLEKGAPARDRYVNAMLRGGSSDYAIPILKAAGVDMLSSDPYEKAAKLFERRMDEAQKIIDSMKKK